MNRYQQAGVTAYITEKIDVDKRIRASDQKYNRLKNAGTLRQFDGVPEERVFERQIYKGNQANL